MPDAAKPKKITPKKAAAQRDMWVGLLEGEHETLVNVAKAMPASGLAYKPEPRLMDFRALALHIAGAGAFFADLIERGQMPAPSEEQAHVNKAGTPETPESLAGVLQSMLAGTLARFRAATPEQLAKRVDFFGTGKHPGVEFIAWHLFHLIHHRGQLSTYLRVSGHKVPSIYGPTADVPFEDLTKKP
ncbi:MAG: DinB family protein [Planctomycetes bacterium]|nr:DinB family protein [Planctomycetota bacterium]